MLRAFVCNGIAVSLVLVLICTTELFHEDRIFYLTECETIVASSNDSQSNRTGSRSLGYKSGPKAELHSANEGRIVGFFHLFEKNSDVFSRIVNEQVTYVNDSGVLDNIAFISYVYFGTNHVSFRIPSPSKKYIKSPKSNVSGNELDTLQLLYEHCVQHPHDRVFYLHTKGSYHPHHANDVLRQNLMKAVLSCIKTFGDEGQGDTDVCGLRASPVPYPQLSGVPSYILHFLFLTMPSKKIFNHSA